MSTGPGPSCQPDHATGGAQLKTLPLPTEEGSESAGLRVRSASRRSGSASSIAQCPDPCRVARRSGTARPRPPQAARPWPPSPASASSPYHLSSVPL